MGRYSASVLLAVPLVATPAWSQGKTNLPDTLVLGADRIISVEINGRPFRLEVRPEAPEAPMLNPDVAQALQLKPGMFGFINSVGPERVNGNSAVHRVDYGEGPKKQRIFWADRPSSYVADGTISPASLPYTHVRFVLAESTPGETTYRLPLDNFGFLGRYGIGTTVKAQGQKIQFQFSLQRDETLVGAPTGNWLAENYAGTFTAPAKSTLIYYGINRPTRTMTLSSALDVGAFSLRTVDVRVSDYGDASGIADQAADRADDQEILVVGKRDKDVDLRITAGRQFLAGCSSLSYDFAKREIGLSCKATGG